MTVAPPRPVDPSTAAAAVATPGGPGTARHPLSPTAALGVPLLLAAGLLALAGRYGYHRDELYFRLLAEQPAWGYVDQPPLTPLLAGVSTALLGDTTWALRTPAALLAGLLALLLAVLARELGGGARAQVVAALGACGASPLISGHLLLTASLDWVAWAGVGVLVVRALHHGREHAWVWAGAVAGLALANKLLVLLLLGGLAVGLLLVGPRGVLGTRWPWLGAGLAALLGAPTLAYQVAHDLPQLQMAGSLTGDAARWLVLPGQLLVLGPPAVLVWGAGAVALWRAGRWPHLRALPAAYVVAVVLLLVTGGQFYYTTGFLLLLWAAGAVSLAPERGEGPLGRGRLHRLVAVNVVTSALVALPLLPVPVLAASPVPLLNPAVGDQVGWQRYVAQVEAVVAGLPTAERSRAVVLAENYGQAGALERYGGGDLPPVVSGHNALHDAGPPGTDRDVAVALVQDPDRTGGHVAGTPRLLRATFRTCEPAAVLDSGTGVPNEEQGTTVVVCRGLRTSWEEAWPAYRHVGLSTFCHPCARLTG